ncbi:nickel-dependent lactate racemase [bacterium]|nr:nickel-dependent lactate racemase [bacterium]
MLKVRQHFDRPVVENIAETVLSELKSLQLETQIQPGQTVAVTVGSRGIANITTIIKTTVDFLKSLDAIPLIIPAMGSHGGGTAEGQRQIVEGYGLTEDFLGCEIRSSMETVVVAETPQGIPVHFDKNAFEADHVLVCNRIKAHTRFIGDIESGLHKMMLIGLGKHAGAKIYHQAIYNYSFDEIIRAVAEQVLQKCSVVAGLAIVENAYDETGLIRAVAPADFYEQERKLCRQSKEWLPQLPFADVDVLIVDRIGKNISGTGLDTNIVGRKYNDHEAREGDSVRVNRIFVRSLTEETHGNGTGIGIAEFTNKRTIEQIDQQVTAVNCITGGHPEAAMLPISFVTDVEVLEAACSTVGLKSAAELRLTHISDTLHLSELLVSEAYLPEFEGREELEIISGPESLWLESDGNLRNVINHFTP